MGLKFHVVMPTSSMDGYGYSGECLVLGARKLGADVTYTSHDWKEPTFTDSSLLELEDTEAFNEINTWGTRTMRDSENPLVVYFIPFAFHHFRAQYQIGQTMFETNEIPDVWAQFCSIPKGLIVPSQFCKDTFAYKVNTQIEVVPLGVDINTYHYMDRTPAKTFTFLMAGLLHYRKGAEFAVRAFKEEFNESEPVRLVLKTRKGFLDIGDETLRDDIEVINYDYSREEMLDLYHAADCFISCSRGEASGLTPREAMATGLPTIVTDWGGLREIADPMYTYPIGIDDLEDAPKVCSSYSEGITQGQSIGQFCRPSVEQLKRTMREVYEDQKASRFKGRWAAGWIKREWNYEVCAGKWLTAIETIFDEARRPKTKSLIPNA